MGKIENPCVGSGALAVIGPNGIGHQCPSCGLVTIPYPNGMVRKHSVLVPPPPLEPEAEKKPRSAAAKGSYYRDRTRKWLEEEGWAVALLERMAWIRRGGAPCPVCKQASMFPTKIDQFGADLLAIKHDDIAFVQVKLGTSNVGAARIEFLKHPFPPFAKRWIAVWEKGDHAPRIIECSRDTPVDKPLPKTKTRRPLRAGDQKLLF